MSLLKMSRASLEYCIPCRNTYSEFDHEGVHNAAHHCHKVESVPVVLEVTLGGKTIVLLDWYFELQWSFVNHGACMNEICAFYNDPYISHKYYPIEYVLYTAIYQCVNF